MGTINGSGMSRHRIQASGYASVRKAELTRALPDRAQLCFTLKPKRLCSCKTPWEVVKRQEEILAQLLGQTPGTKGDQDEKRFPPAMHCRFAASVLSTQSSAMKGKRSEDLEQMAPPRTKGFWGDVALIRTSGFV